MELIRIIDGELQLCSGLTESAFAKTRYSLMITSKGILAEAELKNSDSISSFKFSDWNFESIKSFETEKNSEAVVYYCAKLPENVTEFTALADNIDFENAKLVFSAIIASKKENIKLPEVFGGILISRNENKISLLFLPEQLFCNSASAFSEQIYAKYLGLWQNKQLSESASENFFQSVLAYKTLSGQFPFSAQNEDERVADIADRKFLPVEYAVNGINEKLAAFINHSFKITKATQSAVKEQFPFDLFEESTTIKECEKLSEEEFKKQAEEFLKSQNSKITKKRTIHRNSTKILICAGAAILILCFVNSILKSQKQLPTTIGLTASQTVEAFFQAINEKDVQLMMNVTKGKAFKYYLNSISGITVANAAGQAYSFKSLNLEPQKWLFKSTTEAAYSKTSAYGITNLKIDGKDALLNVTLKSKLDKPIPVTEEKGIHLENGMKSVQKIQYFVLQSDNETGEIFVNKSEGTVTLTYFKNKWLLTDMNALETPVQVDYESFKKQYFSGISANNGDVIKTVNTLRKEFPWLPYQSVLEIEKAKTVPAL